MPTKNLLLRLLSLRQWRVRQQCSASDLTIKFRAIQPKFSPYLMWVTQWRPVNLKCAAICPQNSAWIPLNEVRRGPLQLSNCSTDFSCSTLSHKRRTNSFKTSCKSLAWGLFTSHTTFRVNLDILISNSTGATVKWAKLISARWQPILKIIWLSRKRSMCWPTIRNCSARTSTCSMARGRVLPTAQGLNRVSPKPQPRCTPHRPKTPMAHKPSYEFLKDLIGKLISNSIHDNYRASRAAKYKITRCFPSRISKRRLTIAAIRITTYQTNRWSTRTRSTVTRQATIQQMMLNRGPFWMSCWPIPQVRTGKHPSGTSNKTSTRLPWVWTRSTHISRTWGTPLLSTTSRWHRHPSNRRFNSFSKWHIDSNPCKDNWSRDSNSATPTCSTISTHKPSSSSCSNLSSSQDKTSSFRIRERATPSAMVKYSAYRKWPRRVEARTTRMG